MTTRIAVPIADGMLCSHFGQCESFALFSFDPQTATIISRRDAIPPHHAPGVYPGWLAGEGVSVVLAGGMGGAARELFAGNGIRVVLGVAPDSPEKIVQAYLAGQLAEGENACDHGTKAHNCDQ